MAMSSVSSESDVEDSSSAASAAGGWNRPSGPLSPGRSNDFSLKYLRFLDLS